MRLILSIFLFCGLFTAGAQDDSLLNKFIADIANTCVNLDYTYTARVSGVNNNGSGSLLSQGHMWSLKGNGVEMYCDGTTVWVVDPSSKEVIIEPVSDEQETAFLTNPAQIVLSIGDSFKVSSVNVSSDAKSQIFSLVPKSESAIEYLNVELLNGSALIRNMSFALNDGTLVTIKVSSMKLTPMVSVEMFKPQTVFDSGWIVTDLR